MSTHRAEFSAVSLRYIQPFSDRLKRSTITTLWSPKVEYIVMPLSARFVFQILL